MKRETMSFPISGRSPLAGGALVPVRIVGRINSIARERVPAESAATVAGD
jgi:hypothetical protein